MKDILNEIVENLNEFIDERYDKFLGIEKPALNEIFSNVSIEDEKILKQLFVMAKHNQGKFVSQPQRTFFLNKRNNGDSYVTYKRYLVGKNDHPITIKYNFMFDDYGIAEIKRNTNPVRNKREEVIWERPGSLNEQPINEKVYKVYHGTNQQFDKFDFKKTAQGIIWFTDSLDSIKKGEHGGQGNKYIMTRYITINKPAGWAEYEKYGLGQLEDMGFDGVILPQGDKTDYFVFNNKSIKKTGPKEL